MSAELSIPPDQLAPLTRVLDIDLSVYETLTEDSESSDWMRARDMEKHMVKVLPASDLGKDLSRVLLSWRSLSFQFSERIDDVVDGFRKGLARSVGAPELLAKFDFKRDAILKLLKSKGVRRVAKVLSLSYEYSHLFQAARIITDIRPVYDEDGEGFLDSVVSHTFSLKYDSAGVDYSLSLALDLNDIEHLKKECERAIAKARTAKDFMEGVKIRTIISGQDENE